MNYLLALLDEIINKQTLDVMALQQRDFDESKHPRDEHGRWTDGGGNGDGNEDTGDDYSDSPRPSVSVAKVHAARSELASVAQEVYDDWQDEDSGGISDRIAGKISLALSDMGIETADGGHDEHSWVIANLKEGVYKIDVPLSVYAESGTKKPDVTITADHVVVARLEEPISDFEFADRYQERSFTEKDFDEFKHVR
jgi:hypothetical protein